MTRTLLIDADVVAYQAASSCEKATHWGDGYWTWHCDEAEVKQSVHDQIEKMMDELKGSKAVLCLTDSAANFRFGVLPTYKGNRTNLKKPLVLKAIKQWMIDDLGAYFRDGLEGDDCMGILATMPKRQGEHVIVSIDKDMATIPALVCRPVKCADGATNWDITEVTEPFADAFHLKQALMGDTTDGYSGCPSFGPKTAEKLLAEFFDDGTFDGAGAWKAVVAAFEKKGLSEAAALQQARVARILRASDYNFKEKRPILWQPQSSV